MEDLLSPASTRYLAQEEVVSEGLSELDMSKLLPKTQVSSAGDALQKLRSKPDLDTLREILRWLDPKRARSDDFNIRDSGVEASQLIQVLVNSTIPDCWATLTRLQAGSNVSRPERDRDILLRCLRSVTGLGAIIARFREFLIQGEVDTLHPGQLASLQQVSELLDILALLLHGDNFLRILWRDLRELYADTIKIDVSWKEIILLFGGGRLLSIAAQARFKVEESSLDESHSSWIGNGALYSQWLGRNIFTMAARSQIGDIVASKAAAQLLGKALSLGYTEEVVEALLVKLIASRHDQTQLYRQMLKELMPHEQRAISATQLRVLSKKYGNQHSTAEPLMTAGIAAIIDCTVKENDSLQEELFRWLLSPLASSFRGGTLIRRAAIIVLSQDETRLRSLLEQSLKQFGDKLHISHTPILQQEVNTQIVLLTAGYLHRRIPDSLSKLTRSSLYLNAISNRLSAPSDRSRILGMLVGTALSDLVDGEGRKMKFGMDELENADSLWYLGLTKVEDRIGCLSDLEQTMMVKIRGVTALPTPDQEQRHISAATSSKILSIEEVSDEGISDDSSSEEFSPYAKPDSDHSDSEEDVTLLKRDRPNAPVYIRDLLSYLSNTESYDHQHLGLSTAASLIRRKANFGTEVSDHLDELASRLVGLADKYDMEDFDSMRLQAMIAVILAKPLEMGQWYSKTFFDGDYSIGQRATVLNALGLGARELAELSTPTESQELIRTSSSVHAATATTIDSTSNTFPSKQLPPKLHALYAPTPRVNSRPKSKPSRGTTTPIIDTLATRLQQTMITPMAISAADQLSGPNALKVRTFSSRMQVEKNRSRPKANQLSKIVGPAFIFPLAGRWWSNSRTSSTHAFHKELLPAYLHTLAIILHAASPSTPSLPDLTNELFPVVLAVLAPSSRTGSVSTAPEIEPLLLLLLTVVTCNLESPDRGRGLVSRHAKELDEARGWVEAIFESQAGHPEEKVRMLAASVLVKMSELPNLFYGT